MKILTSLLVLIAIGVAGFWWFVLRTVAPPDVPFVMAVAGAPEVDFARLEVEAPLSDADLAKLTPANLQALSQEQVDQIYARLVPGAIPDGAFDGDLFFPRGTDASRFAEIIGGGVADGLKGFAANIGVAKLEFLGARLWRGKVFDSQEKVLRNRITDLRSLALLLDEDEVDELEALVDGDIGQAMLFPAKLYCGQSLLDGRRESIIIDYAYTDDLPGYLEKLDHLVGREGLQIRDEIRQVRPGFYLGRAYISRVFALNFTLYNEALDTQASGTPATNNDADCWSGEQDRELRLSAAR